MASVAETYEDWNYSLTVPDKHPATLMLLHAQQARQFSHPALRSTVQELGPAFHPLCRLLCRTFSLHPNLDDAYIQNVLWLGWAVHTKVLLPRDGKLTVQSPIWGVGTVTLDGSLPQLLQQHHRRWRTFQLTDYFPQPFMQRWQDSDKPVTEALLKVYQIVVHVLEQTEYSDSDIQLLVGQS